MTTQQLAALHALCFATPRPWRAQEFETLLQTAGVFLETLDFSFAIGRVIADEAELLTLAVHPDNQRQGHGKTLLAAYEVAAKTCGADWSFLEVAASNTPAICLYESAGYRESGRRRGYYRTPAGERTDAILLRKALN